MVRLPAARSPQSDPWHSAASIITFARRSAISVCSKSGVATGRSAMEDRAMLPPAAQEPQQRRALVDPPNTGIYSSAHVQRTYIPPGTEAPRGTPRGSARALLPVAGGESQPAGDARPARRREGEPHAAQ